MNAQIIHAVVCGDADSLQDAVTKTPCTCDQTDAAKACPTHGMRALGNAGRAVCSTCGTYLFEGKCPHCNTANANKMHALQGSGDPTCYGPTCPHCAAPVTTLVCPCDPTDTRLDGLRRVAARLGGLERELVGHHVFSPLTALLCGLDLLSGDTLTPEGRREVGSEVAAAADRLRHVLRVLTGRE